MTYQNALEISIPKGIVRDKKKIRKIIIQFYQNTWKYN